jgi:hypothetical protein
MMLFRHVNLISVIMTETQSFSEPTLGKIIVRPKNSRESLEATVHASLRNLQGRH